MSGQRNRMEADCRARKSKLARISSLETPVSVCGRPGRGLIVEQEQIHKRQDLFEGVLAGPAAGIQQVWNPSAPCGLAATQGEFRLEHWFAAGDGQPAPDVRRRAGRAGRFP